MHTNVCKSVQYTRYCIMCLPATPLNIIEALQNESQVATIRPKNRLTWSASACRLTCRLQSLAVCWNSAGFLRSSLRQALTSSSVRWRFSWRRGPSTLAEGKGRRKRTTTNATLRFEWRVMTCDFLVPFNTNCLKLLKMDKLKSFDCWNCWNCWNWSKIVRNMDDESIWIAQKSWGRCHGLDTRHYCSLLREDSIQRFEDFLWYFFIFFLSFCFFFS